MKEELLHYIWKHKKFYKTRLVTTVGEEISVHKVGDHNLDAGPDFFNAQLSIDEQLWAGNVEIHINSSDWYVHGHENDANYENVILHVVWNHDVEIFRKDNSKIVTLELKNSISKELLLSYQKLLDSPKKFINCEKDITNVDDFVKDNWLENLFLSRLQQKSSLIQEELFASKNDWDAVFFRLLFKNFGLKVNGQSFYNIASALDFNVIRKLRNNPFQLEALFYGISGLLPAEEAADSYVLNLRKEYLFLKSKFKINELGIVQPKFFQLRPYNFPTIRLSQLANLYAKNKHLFSEVMEAKSKEDLYRLLSAVASEYWDSHFSFGKDSKISKKKTTLNFINLLVINTIVPLKFCYAKYKGEQNHEELISLMRKIKAENNSIIAGFQKYNLKANSAFDSQALLQNYTYFCTKNKCLQCAIGNTILSTTD